MQNRFSNEQSPGTKGKGNISSSHCLVLTQQLRGEKQLFMAGSEQTIPAVLGEISIMATVLLL